MSNQLRMSGCGPNLRIVRVADKRLECSKDAACGGHCDREQSGRLKRRLGGGFLHRAVAFAISVAGSDRRGHDRAIGSHGGQSPRPRTATVAQTVTVGYFMCTLAQGFDNEICATATDKS